MPEPIPGFIDSLLLLQALYAGQLFYVVSMGGKSYLRHATFLANPSPQYVPNRNIERP